LLHSGRGLQEKEEEVIGHWYKLDGVNATWDGLSANVSVVCQGGQYEGDKCISAWRYWYFWLFILLVFLGQVSFSTANSVTDAIVVDTIGEDGGYGLQRAWGTVGWGLMGPISGLLVDWWS
ncbi:hypothetical protein OTU49_013224, partial [Cherax quadricarinatus]